MPSPLDSSPVQSSPVHWTLTGLQATFLSPVPVQWTMSPVIVHWIPLDCSGIQQSRTAPSHGCRCHVAIGDVATRRRTTTSVVRRPWMSTWRNNATRRRHVDNDHDGTMTLHNNRNTRNGNPRHEANEDTPGRQHNTSTPHHTRKMTSAHENDETHVTANDERPPPSTNRDEHPPTPTHERRRAPTKNDERPPPRPTTAH
ncbi:uncharacterized protein LACBIDRAFT_332543 [Laccaria bicolor S238N-H82]|uniref:Predicted protein n=1 Tax=Laccaria bicolor (strain S238N-H82 / ATCC MYA-4686) TaxID=486041 RepID=B0DT32_LACBS|nr:uncharacterized protein LACBIDRAFT_332543 [Laccaria bicolor S238N-H82]EDR02204.1 predicted protein [Laccaria bicolor S238N-H82]|eukprot:XP_001887149.1 predicted protein [Laccaria bicolor S238N-H82]